MMTRTRKRQRTTVDRRPHHELPWLFASTNWLLLLLALPLHDKAAMATTQSNQVKNDLFVDNSARAKMDPAQYSQCAIAMLLNDENPRDNRMSAGEFVAFLNRLIDMQDDRNDDTLDDDSTTSTLDSDHPLEFQPTLFQDLFQRGLRDGQTTINIEGARPGTTQDTDQVDFLNDFCQDTFDTIQLWLFPTLAPTRTPTFNPTKSPTWNPTVLATSTPSDRPSRIPTPVPTIPPSTQQPSSNAPSIVPSNPPTIVPTSVPTTYETSDTPSISPTMVPTTVPTTLPTKTETSFQPTGLSTALNSATAAPTPPVGSSLVNTTTYGFNATFYNGFVVALNASMYYSTAENQGNDTAYWQNRTWVQELQDIYWSFVNRTISQTFTNHSQAINHLRNRRQQEVASLPFLESVQIYWVDQEKTCDQENPWNDSEAWKCRDVFASFDLLFLSEMVKEETLAIYQSVTEEAIENGELQNEVEKAATITNVFVLGGTANSMPNSEVQSLTSDPVPKDTMAPSESPMTNAPSVDIPDGVKPTPIPTVSPTFIPTKLPTNGKLNLPSLPDYPTRPPENSASDPTISDPSTNSDSRMGLLLAVAGGMLLLGLNLGCLCCWCIKRSKRRAVATSETFPDANLAMKETPEAMQSSGERNAGSSIEVSLEDLTLLFETKVAEFLQNKDIAERIALPDVESTPVEASVSSEESPLFLAKEQVEVPTRTTENIVEGQRDEEPLWPDIHDNEECNTESSMDLTEIGLQPIPINETEDSAESSHLGDDRVPAQVNQGGGSKCVAAHPFDSQTRKSMSNCEESDNCLEEAEEYEQESQNLFSGNVTVETVVESEDYSHESMDASAEVSPSTETSTGFEADAGLSGVSGETKMRVASLDENKAVGETTALMDRDDQTKDLPDVDSAVCTCQVEENSTELTATANVCETEKSAVHDVTIRHPDSKDQSWGANSESDTSDIESVTSSLHEEKLSSQVPDNIDSEHLDFRDRVTRLVEQMMPDEVNNIDLMIEEFQGREEELLAAIKATHDLESSSDEADSKGSADESSSESSSQDCTESESISSNADVRMYRNILVQLVEQVMPSEISNIDVMMKQFQGREDELIATLQSMADNSDDSQSDGDNDDSTSSRMSRQDDHDEDNMSASDTDSS